MTKWAETTWLQDDVIRRLRAAGYDALADAAKDAWTHGEPVNVPNMVYPGEAALRDDYERANGQAVPEDYDFLIIRRNWGGG